MIRMTNGRLLAAAIVALVGWQLQPRLAYAHHGDFDSDTIADGVEFYGGSDGTSAGSVPESLTVAALGIGAAGVCSNAVDDDGDGFTDGGDPGCNNTDGDAYFIVPLDDTVESNLGSNPLNALSGPESWYIDFISGGFVTTCTNGLDDDADTGTDFADIGCFPDVDLDNNPIPSDSEGCFLANTSGLFGTADCGDGEDNDGDGNIDGADSDCSANVDGDDVSDSCDTEGNQPNITGIGGLDDCYDGVDNDADGDTDLIEADCHLCYGNPSTQEGTAVAENLSGTPGVDVILGHAGDDIIRGLDGDDFLCGGPGADKLIGSGGNDFMGGGDGIDKLVGGADNDFLDGSAGDDKLIGSVGNDVFQEASGDNLMVGSSGDDTLFASGSGNNVMKGSGGNDIIVFSGTGSQIVRAGGGNDTIFMGDGNDTINCGGGVDGADGGLGTDVATSNCEGVSNVP